MKLVLNVALQVPKIYKWYSIIDVCYNDFIFLLNPDESNNVISV